MKRLPEVTGKLMFNQRVLELGATIPGKVYSLEELREKLFYNRIFRSNMDELFRREDCSDIITPYLESMLLSIGYVWYIMGALNSVQDKILLESEENFEQRLILQTKLSGQYASQLDANYFPLTELHRVVFVDEQIYYLALIGSLVSVYTVNDQQSIFSKPITHSYPGYDKFWKTDDCIHRYISRLLGPTVAIAVVNDKASNCPVKIEYFGDYSVLKILIPHFAGKPLIFANPHLYLGDLDQVLTDLTDDQRTPVMPVSVDDDNNFTIDSLFEKDLLIEYPMTSFDVYLRLLHLVSVDPRVTSISLCLYRIGDNPIIYYILRDAVRRGIKVTVNIELEATGEQINLFWWTEMKRASIDVTTYNRGYRKVHAKVMLVRFNDGRQLCQVGTGNYHWETTSKYTDLSYVTSNNDICQSAKQFFEMLRQERDVLPSFDDKFLVTCYNARDILIKEIRIQANTIPGRISIKCNELNDEQIITELEKAAESHCTIELIVRGMCTWIPDQNYKNVSIRSVVWDKLEHSRVYYFGWKHPRVYLGSLDPVKSKFDERIEVLVRVMDDSLVDQLKWYIQRYLAIDENSWEMIRDSDGTRYEREMGKSVSSFENSPPASYDDELRRCQEYLSKREGGRDELHPG